MVVEDEPDIYEVLLAMFEMWGIEGVAFVDGEEAVAWVDDVDNGRFKGELPELALLDIRLPGDINGAMVGERLRKSTQLGNIAIVLITAFKLTPDEEKAIIKQAGADRLVYKPLPRFNELQTLLESVIAERRNAATPQAVVVKTPSAKENNRQASKPVSEKPEKTDSKSKEKK
jgi:CheY-like chemotaxis protein